MPWRLASPWGDSPPRNSWTTWRLNSIECVRCLAMGFLLESPVQLADSQVRHLSTPRGALHSADKCWHSSVEHHCAGPRIPRGGVLDLGRIAIRASNLRRVPGFIGGGGVRARDNELGDRFVSDATAVHVGAEL